MSYEVTATRRRPQRFDDLVGQEFVAETLKNSIKSGKIAHAYLFSGPRGCGKTSTARILAKALNCAEGPTDNPCGKCSNCLEITKGSSLDVIEIDGASNTSVDNIRQIKEEVMFPPANCRYKIYIIDEVHMLSTSAFNALLKTIEEPPEHVIFIFATTELQKVPATIKSRCQQYNFRLVSIEKVKQCLAEAAAEMNIQADDEALFWIARESTGSMRDAYTLFDQVVAFSEGHITYEKIRDKLGLVGIDRLNTIFEACANSQTEVVINLIDEFLQGGISIEQFISNCADYLRSLLLIKNGVTKEALLGNSKERYSSVVLANWNAVQIERALSIYLQLYRDIRYSLSPRYELELAFSRLCWLNQYVSNAEVKKAIDAAQALLIGAPVQSAQVTQQAPNAQSVQTSQTVQVMQNPESEVQASAPSETQPAAQSVVRGVPAGLPRLSMLDALDDSSESESSTGESGEENPFHNGGPLPPQQSVAAYIPSENESYTENPEIEEDDGWTNTDTPPDDDYYSEEDYAQQAEASYEQSIAKVEDQNTASVQLDETFVLPNGNQVSIAQLRGSVTASLAINDGFAASALEKTGKWLVTSDGVETTVENDYDLSCLEKKVQIISQELSAIYGKSVQFKVSMHKKEDDNSAAQVEIPPQVNLLVDMFKGTIVAGKK